MSRYRFVSGLACWVVLVAAISAWAVVPEMQVGRIDGAITIDGHLTEAAWRSAGCVPVFVDWVSGEAAEVQTTVRLGWNSEFLLVAFDCQEPNIAALVVDRTERDSELWHNDSVEMFVLPPGDAGRYYHFIISPTGVLHDARVYDTSYDANIEVGTTRSGNRWVVEAQIPWEQIGGMPREAMIWRVNFTRTRKVEAVKTDDGLSCWSRSRGSFHNVDSFGKVVFVGSAPNVERLDMGSRQLGDNEFHLAGHAWSDETTVEVRVSGLERPWRKLVHAAGGQWQCGSGYVLDGKGGGGLLELSLASEGGVFYRQDFPVHESPLNAVLKMEPALDRLRKMLSRQQGPGWIQAEAERILAQGEKVIQNARDYLKSLAERGVEFADSEDEWRRIVGQTDALRERLNRPVLWSHNPFEEATPDMMPIAADDLQLEMSAVVNEYESASILITNVFGDKPLCLRAAVTALSVAGHAGPMGYGGESYWGENVQLSEVVMIRTLKRGVMADPVAELDGAGRVIVGVGETVELWLTVNTRGMKPRLYQGTVNLKGMDPLDGIPEMLVPVTLRVWPVEIPDQTDFVIGAWDYNKGGLYESALEDLLEHRINFFHIVPSHILGGRVPCMPGSDDRFTFELMDSFIDRVKGHGKIFVDACWCGFVQGKNHWQPWHGKMIQELVRYLESHELRYEDWYLHISDENITNEFLEMAKQLKAVDANVQLTADPMSVQMMQIEQLERFAEYIDLWIPHHATLDYAGMEVLHRSNKPILTYHCDPGKATSPELNRMLPLKAWAYELDGVLIWSYMEGYGDLWDDFDGPQHDWAKVYMGPTGKVTPSKRWQAWREGLEDVLLLMVLEGEVEKRGMKAVDENLISEARQLGKSGLKGLTAVEDISNRVVQRIMELTSGD